MEKTEQQVMRSANAMSSEFPEYMGEAEVIAIVYGDVNGDGNVSLLDAMFLSRHMSGWSNVRIDEAAADLNKDGRINILDLVVMERFLGKWAGYETLPYQP